MKKAVPHVAASPYVFDCADDLSNQVDVIAAGIVDERMWQSKTRQGLKGETTSRQPEQN
jgi:hypothetical protein